MPSEFAAYVERLREIVVRSGPGLSDAVLDTIVTSKVAHTLRQLREAEAAAADSDGDDDDA